MNLFDEEQSEGLSGIGEEGGCTRVTSVFDSRAGVSVAPEELCPHVPIVPSPGSKSGQVFKVASGHKVPKLGQKLIRGRTDEWEDNSIHYQVADVTRPLNAVSKICDRGNIVTFNSEGGVIHYLWTGRETRFGREHGIYTLHTWVRSGESAQGFPGQPR